MAEEGCVADMRRHGSRKPANARVRRSVEVIVPSDRAKLLIAGRDSEKIIGEVRER